MDSRVALGYGYSRVVMRDLGADVMEYMCLRDSVGEKTTEPCEDGSGTTEELTIKSRKSTALAVDMSEFMAFICTRETYKLKAPAR